MIIHNFLVSFFDDDYELFDVISMIIVIIGYNTSCIADWFASFNCKLGPFIPPPGHHTVSDEICRLAHV
jgi:hypothetical protein